MKLVIKQPNQPKLDELYPEPEQIEKLYLAWQQGPEALRKALEENEKRPSVQEPEEPPITE